VILFGATGMVGQGVLRECLVDAGVGTCSWSAQPAGQQHAKLHEILHDNFMDFSAIESQLRGYDACFFCLGVPRWHGPGALRHLTTTSRLRGGDLGRAQPGHGLHYVTAAARIQPSRAGALGARQGQDRERSAQAAVQAAYMFRPAGIQPLHGVRSKTSWVNAIYVVAAPLLSYLARTSPNS